MILREAFQNRSTVSKSREVLLTRSMITCLIILLIESLEIPALKLITVMEELPVRVGFAGQPTLLLELPVLIPEIVKLINTVRESIAQWSTNLEHSALRLWSAHLLLDA
jgi:hypothetical protein